MTRLLLLIVILAGCSSSKETPPAAKTPADRPPAAAPSPPPDASRVAPTPPATTPAAAEPPKESRERRKVRLFKEKVAHFLEEARAAGRLLTTGPSLEAALAKSAQVTDLYTHLPEVPPEIDRTGEVANNLDIIRTAVETGADMVRHKDEPARFHSVELLKTLFAGYHKAADEINKRADAVEIKVGI